MGSSVPTLGLGLKLSPSTYEARFWSSSTFRTAATYLDYWSLGVNFVVNASVFKWHLKLGDHQAMLRLFIVVFFIAWGMIQIIWSRLFPDAYFKRRHHVVIFNRTFRFVTFCTVMLSVKQADITPGVREGLIDAFDRTKLWLTVPTTGITIRNILCMSTSVLVFIHGINTPLPFRQQILVHLVCTAILLSVPHSNTVRLLQDLIPGHEVQNLCVSLNSAAQMAELIMVGKAVNVAFLNIHCAEHGVSMLVMFADIYFGLLLPVYVAYRVEQAMKQAYVQQTIATMQLQGRQQAPAAADDEVLAIGPVLLDLLLVSSLGVLLWVFVHNWHDLLYVLTN